MENYTIRLTEQQKKSLVLDAKAHGVTLAEWIRMRLFEPTTIDDFGAFKADQQDAFRRVSDLLCDNLATVQLVTNICCDIVRGVKNDDEHVIPRLKELLAKCADQKKEMKGHE